MRKAEEKANEERKRPHESDENEMSEIRQGLHLMGFNVDLIE